MSTSASYQENELSKQMELLSENDKNRVINNVCLPLIEHPNDHCIEQEKPKFYKIDETGDEGKMNDSWIFFKNIATNPINELKRNEIMELTPSSEFVLKYTDEDDYMQVLKEIFKPVDKLFPESVIEFLNEFFSELVPRDRQLRMGLAIFTLVCKQQSVLEATSNMDRLTQLQDAIDQLAQLFHTSIVHLNQPQNHDAPKLKEDRELIVQDLCKKAKEIDTLIENLPGIKYSEKEQTDIIKSLEEELQEANREYLKMVQNAGSLLKKINDTINIIAKDQSLAKDLE
ncbi:14000_t:CDS:10 [Entrophospora sp. SA101]|nr:14000_t:CDS:10 [Entrophospora sp. SA101]